MRKYGWKKDTFDKRDKKFTQVKKFRLFMPKQADIRTALTGYTIFDQGGLGSCTANAISQAIWYERRKQLGAGEELASRLFIYYNERKAEGTINDDAGAMIRTGIKQCAELGVCPESLWSYIEDRYTQEPPSICYTNATNNQVLGYFRLNNTSLRQLKSCIADGYGFVFGFSVFESFMGTPTATTGIMQMPQPNEQPEGGHAVFAVGYDDAKRCFIVQNSWGNSWGNKGFFTMPYDYITNTMLADDFWTIRLMEA